MSQPTVTAGITAVNDLNPNAQQFFSHDSQQRTVPTGLTALPPPSDISTVAYMDNRSAGYFPAYAYPAYSHPGNSTAFDSQASKQDSPTSSTDPSSPASNQSTMPDKSQLSPEQIRQKLRTQLEYYFSKANLINDIYLQSQMDADNYVPISILIDFKLVKRLTDDLQLLVDVLKEIPSVEVDADETRVRSTDPNTYLNQRKRCIIILRNVPVDATESEVSEIFRHDYCAVSGAIEYERVLGSNHTDCWYLTFASEDDAQHAFLYLTRENISIRGQKILARMKTRLWQKPSAVPERKPSPVPVELVEERKTTSTPSQQRYTLVYLQPTLTSHGNQPTLVPNLQQASHYRPAAPVFQSPYFPMNYNAYLPYDRLAWANAQSANLTSYPTAVHPMVANHQGFPSSYWYLPSTTDPTIVPLQSLLRTYNNGARPKARTMREYSSTSKAQNSVKASTSESSRPDEVPINPNDQCNSNHNTASLASDTSNSPVSDPRVLNHHPVALEDNHSSSVPQVSTAIFYNQSSSLDGANPRSYADTLKFKQMSEGKEHLDAVATVPALEQLTMTDNTSTGNGSRDRHRNKRYHGGNARLYHRSRDDPSQQQSTVHRAPQ